MDAVKNAMGIILLYLPVPAVIAIVIAVVLMIKWKIKKAVLKIILAAAASVAVIWFLGPFTKGPHATFTWKHIIKTETLSKEEVYDAMEICKDFFRNNEADNNRWLQELQFEENEQSHFFSDFDNSERIIITPKIKNGYFFYEDFMSQSVEFCLKRENGGEWSLVYQNDLD
ncbi:MAG: hypothetical protein IKW96_04060 [Ruminococcus sp.]|uniref:hypothetical protein n=1 Tax=Ruminococcus sp. TaxID=41978 RepID=UPI0025E98498|nr:hypothetical protein [Ruminococcus sp.]MBR5682444.1 hypothetical protein [Ruminococcus sp.]